MGTRSLVLLLCAVLGLIAVTTAAVVPSSRSSTPSRSRTPPSRSSTPSPSPSPSRTRARTSRSPSKSTAPSASSSRSRSVSLSVSPSRSPSRTPSRSPSRTPSSSPTVSPSPEICAPERASCASYPEGSALLQSLSVLTTNDVTWGACKCRPKFIRFRLTGGPCYATTNHQGGQMTCSKTSVSKRPNSVSVSPEFGTISGSFNLEDVFTLVGPNEGELAPVTQLVVVANSISYTLTIQTSCSQPIAVNDVFGPITVVSVSSCTNSTAAPADMSSFSAVTFIANRLRWFNCPAARPTCAAYLDCLQPTTCTTPLAQCVSSSGCLAAFEAAITAWGEHPSTCMPGVSATSSCTPLDYLPYIFSESELVSALVTSAIEDENVSAEVINLLMCLAPPVQPYITMLPIPPVVDMTSGGQFNITIGVNHNHNFGGGVSSPSTVYGYALDGQTPSFPGPTLLAKSGVAVDVQWTNTLPAPHILSDYVEPSLLHMAAACYPDCGVPAVTHVHGLEVSPEYDGSPFESLGAGQSEVYHYPNTQPAGTLAYHDHAAGLTRLNVWAGLMGAYVIVDDESEQMNLLPECDIPLMITDRMLNVEEGTFGYPKSEATINPTKWAPEGYGIINLVNGVVAPYVELAQARCRLRFINAANTRPYLLGTDTMFQYCTVIGKDAANVRSPTAVPAEGLSLYPFERVDIICDFSNVELGSVFNIENRDQTFDMGMLDVLQIRITSPSESVIEVPAIPATTNSFGDLKQMYEANPGKTRDITLNELLDEDGHPTMLTVSEDNVVIPFMHASPGDPGLSCDLGTVEKWNFYNPTADFHPFHWHVVRVQCGNDDESIDTNSLKDVVPIPNAENEPETITQVCYVACVPSMSLVDPTASKVDFGFSVKEPYMTHCHVLEHEENDMMTLFYIRDPSDNKDELELDLHHSE